MKHYITVWFSLCLLIGLFASCDDRNSVAPTGILYLNVEEDGTLQTRATTEVTHESLQVAILQGEEDTLKVYNDYLTEVKGQRLVLPVGKYIVAVCSNGADGAGWESPLYRGQEEVEVKQGEITNTKITCTIANTKVSVAYGASVKEHFTDYQTTVSNSSGSLVYTRDEYRSGFFTPEKLTVQLNLVNNDGNKFTIKRVYPEIEPQYHYTFKFTISNDDTSDDAGADFDIDVDDEHQEIEYTIFIKEEEELFGKGAPSFTFGGDGFKNNVVSFKKTEDLVLPEAFVKLSVPNGIQSIQVKASSLQFEDLPTFNEKNWNLAVQKGFPVVDLTQTEQTLDLKSLLSRLEPQGTKTATHTFTLTVLDNLFQEVEACFNVMVGADVDVSAEDPIVWAGFAVLKGKSEDLSSVSFMFRKKGDSEFIPITTVEKNELTGEFTAMVPSLQANTSYEYYAIAGDKKSEPVTEFITEGITTIPNSGFNDWCTIDDLPRPWKENESSYWSTGNSTVSVVVTTIHAIMTTPTDDKNEGTKAAYMETKWQTIKLGAGNIFTGDFSLNGTNGVLNLGRAFTSRPSQLKGYYKYSPGQVQSGKGDGSYLSAGDMDLCSIYIILTDKKFTIDTGNNNTLFNPESSLYKDHIIAYGELSEEESRKTVTEYTEFSIDLAYRDLVRVPEYIIIVASSSKYGDYFQGGVGSKMWLDDLKLVYPTSLSEVKLYK